MFFEGYDPKEFDSAAFKASFQKSFINHKQRLHEIDKLKVDYTKTIDELRQRTTNV
jgi:hypothetical protein